MDSLISPTPIINAIPDSAIIDVVRYGRSFEGTLPLWLGEGDQPTPDFISEAAIRSLKAGQTFYTPNRGIPEAREALLRYYKNIFDISLPDRRVSLTNSGMHAINMINMSLLTQGDNLVVLTPCWPNVMKSAQFLGANVIEVATPLVNGAFQLNLDAVFDACDKKTKAIYLASPANPTGWTVSLEEARALLDFSRDRNIALIADEVYQRLSFESAPGFTFLSIAEPHDPLFVVNSFSKAWAMTGWRLGWMVFPDSFHDVFEKLSQFSNSGSPAFLQHGAIAALDHGEELVAETRARAIATSRFTEDNLARIDGVTVIPSSGGFYSMFSVEGFSDAMEFALLAVREAGVGLAPGSAFGKSGEHLLRLCHLKDTAVLAQAFEQLSDMLATRAPAPLSVSSNNEI